MQYDDIVIFSIMTWCKVCIHASYDVNARYIRKTSRYFHILHFTFLFSLFVFASAAGHYFRIWTGSI